MKLVSPFPAGNDVRVQVFLQAGAGGPTKIDADVEPFRLNGFTQRLDRLAPPRPWFEFSPPSQARSESATCRLGQTMR